MYTSKIPPRLTVYAKSHYSTHLPAIFIIGRWKRCRNSQYRERGLTQKTGSTYFPSHTDVFLCPHAPRLSMTVISLAKPIFTNETGDLS
jgi:hypothetical protein